MSGGSVTATGFPSPLATSVSSPLLVNLLQQQQQQQSVVIYFEIHFSLDEAIPIS